jgi:DJ-1 family protein
MKFVALLADGYEDIEALGTVAILRRAGIQVDFVSVLDKDVATGSFGTRVLVDLPLSAVSVVEYDGVLIPGGAQSKTLRENQDVLRLVKAFADSGKWLAAICAGPTVLGVLGLLDGIRYTAFPNTELFMPSGIRVMKPAVTSGNIITGAGAGCVTDFALEIIRAVLGKDKAQEIKKRILFREYD